MKINVHRLKSDNDTTFSTVYIDGRFQCFGLEDEHRDEKVSGETRIPSGSYDIGVRTVGGFDAKYKTRFADIHKGMLQVLDVPNFEYILIHIGNDDSDTAGCLLLGADMYTSNRLHMGSSTIAYKEFYSKVIDAALADDLTIVYSDFDL